jgi:glutathione S-transferase
MYKLYYSPGACSLAVHTVLNEIGADFQLENANDPETKTKSKKFLQINPRGAVPVLEIDGFIVREGAAILTYLIDTHKNSLLPASGLERAHALEWLAFANSTLHPVYGRIFTMLKLLGSKASENPLYQPTINQIQKYWDEIENQLQKTDYLCGENCTAADILVTVIASWSQHFGNPITFGSKTKAFLTRVISRPAFKKALETEQVIYKANA